LLIEHMATVLRDDFLAARVIGERRCGLLSCTGPSNTQSWGWAIIGLDPLILVYQI